MGARLSFGAARGDVTSAAGSAASWDTAVCPERSRDSRKDWPCPPSSRIKTSSPAADRVSSPQAERRTAVPRHTHNRISGA